MKIRIWLWACGFSAIFGLAAQADEVSFGTAIDDFSLPDNLGVQHSLSEWADKKAVVVAFLGTECPLAKLYGPRLAEMARQFEPKGVQFVGINSNQQDTLREIAHYARVHKIEFPILKDNANDLRIQIRARGQSVDA